MIAEANGVRGPVVSSSVVAKSPNPISAFYFQRVRFSPVVPKPVVRSLVVSGPAVQ